MKKINNYNNDYCEKISIFLVIFIFLINLSLPILFDKVNIFTFSYFVNFLMNILFLFGGIILVTLYYNDKIIWKDKKILFYSLISFCFLYIYRNYELIDYKYWNIVACWLNSISLILTPIVILLLIIGYRRILK